MFIPALVTMERLSMGPSRENLNQARPRSKTERALEPHTESRPNWAMASDPPIRRTIPVASGKHTADSPNWALADDPRTPMAPKKYTNPSSSAVKMPYVHPSRMKLISDAPRVVARQRVTMPPVDSGWPQHRSVLLRHSLFPELTCIQSSTETRAGAPF